MQIRCPGKKPGYGGLARPRRPPKYHGGQPAFPGHAAKGGVLNGKSTDLAVHAVFIAGPDQLCKRTSLGGKEKGGVFLAALTTPHALRAPPRSRPPLLWWQPPMPLPLLPRRTTSRLPRPRWPPPGAAVTVHVDAMSKADQRTLLAKLTLAMNH